ncbi:transposase [Caloramator sp. Dgby_cultured_2]|uniref:transposase n=1 Tax=Caloramator sp. Dgby_cultured_2 TaxID=3029174 RepID=UPI00237E5C1A|nr:transposase [Caloramator sp. Dgby_cultured_2]WDU82649.1 transposase [Caloramator sp. Dgby_cultured_2]
MARPRRIEYKGAIYHVYNRGNNKENIFAYDADKKFFIIQLRDYLIKFDYEVLAYCIMSNHYHLMIKCNETPLSKVMYNINNVYSKYYNDKHGRRGHVFENRYNAKIVEDETYLYWLFRYISRNPIRAGIVEKAEDYPWSSFKIYKYNIESFISKDTLLNMISDDKKQAIRFLVNITQEKGDDSSSENDFTIFVDNFKNFINGTKIKILEKDILKNKQCNQRKTLDDILAELKLKDSWDKIKGTSKRKDAIEFKKMFIKAALENKYTLKEIADYLGISASAVSQLKNKVPGT